MKSGESIMKDFFRFDYEMSKRRLIPASVIFVIVAIWAAFAVDKNADFLTIVAAVVAFGLMIGGLVYTWRIVSSIMKPSVDENGNTYEAGGVNGMIMRFGLAMTLGIVLGGFLFAIDIIRTISYKIHLKRTSNDNQ